MDEKWRREQIFFQDYAKYIKFSNTIYHLKDQYGTHERTFEGLSKIGNKYFQELYKEENNNTIDELIWMTQYFPSFANEEDNKMLMEEATLEEWKAVMRRFQTSKIPGPYGWTIEFFLGFFDLLRHGILRLVEEIGLKS